MGTIPRERSAIACFGLDGSAIACLGKRCVPETFYGQIRAATTLPELSS